jgi:hypothetical protein
LAACDAAKAEQRRPIVERKLQHLVVDLAGLIPVLRLEGEAELERGVEGVGRRLMGLAQEFDGALALAGVARHDGLEHVDAVVGRAGGEAGLEHAVDGGGGARLLAEQALGLVDLAAGLRLRR